MGNFEPDWEYLPQLCLFKVLDKLDAPSNLVQFGAVSRHWHSVFNTFLDIKRQSSPNMVPMLLIPTKRSETKRKLYSLQAKTKVSSIELPKSYNKRSCGSCYGWLATVDENMVTTLSNPFKDCISIDLPELEFSNRKPMGYQYDIQKVVLSADPSFNPDSYVVVVIYSAYNRLAFYKSWQKTWIYFDEHLTLLTDIAFYRNLVYVIGHRNNILSFDVNGSFDKDLEDLESPKLKTVLPEDPISDLDAYSDRAYLVESSKGNLYSIHRKLESGDEIEGQDDYLTDKFEVFKLVLDDETGELVEKKEVKSMDGDVVFVGDNGTLAVAALDFPQGQPNSIYFTDDYIDVNAYEPCGPQDIGIFNLKDGSFEKHYQFKPSHKDLPPYIWILPPHQFN